MHQVQALTLIAFMALIGAVVITAKLSEAAVTAIVALLLIIALIGGLAALAKSAQLETQRLYFAVIATLAGFVAGIVGGTAAGTVAGGEAGDSAAAEVKDTVRDEIGTVEEGLDDVVEALEGLE